MTRYFRAVLLLALLLPLFTLISLTPAPAVHAAGASVLGPGRPPSRHFAGYVARSGAELGVARLADGTWGVCLDTGPSRRWPQGTPLSTRKTDPTVAYLLTRYLPHAPHDGVLAAALWWAVGERLNSNPRAVRSHVRLMLRESPAVGRRVVSQHTRLKAEAAAYAPRAGGYVVSAPRMTRDALTIAAPTAGSGRPVPDLPVSVTLSGATFDHGGLTWTGRTTALARTLRLHPTGPVTISASVRFASLASTGYRVFNPRDRRRQRVAASVAPVTAQTRASVAFVPARPRISTRINLQTARINSVLVDRVTVSGVSTEPTAPPVLLSWELRGPVRADTERRCRRASWAGAPVAAAGATSVSADGAITLGRHRISRGGCYSYREQLHATAYSEATGWTSLGLVEESALVPPSSPRIPDHPAVATGGSSDGPILAARTRSIPRISLATVGLNAPLTAVDFVGRSLVPPRTISSAGLWRRGAQLDDVVGTTVIVGHVSDNRARPGAFHRLLRVRSGQTITTTRGSTVTRWRVTAIRQVDRRRLPASLFSQRVERRLILITCSNRVTTPRGGFRYSKNLIIEAVPR